MIRYKVVRINFTSQHVSCYATGDYQLAYIKNTIVTAEESTLGIAVFEKRYQAEDFLKKEFSPDRFYKIIRVISIGRGKRYRFVCGTQDTVNLKWFYRRYGDDLSILLGGFPLIHTMKSPPGAIFYQQVKVIE